MSGEIDGGGTWLCLLGSRDGDAVVQMSQRRPRDRSFRLDEFELISGAVGAAFVVRGGGVTPEAVRLNPAAVRLRKLISSAARPLPPAQQIGCHPTGLS